MEQSRNLDHIGDAAVQREPEPVRWRLGLDIGTNSIGWAAIRLDSDGHPGAVISMGSRIFSDGRNPKDGTSLASGRRAARLQRRRRSRFVRRRNQLLRALVRWNLQPGDALSRQILVNLDPYEIRARGVHSPLDRFELGRALFHLNQRRGFKSNRKSTKDASEEGVVKDGIRRLREQVGDSGFSTVGQWLNARRRRRLSVRARRVDGEKSFTFYPVRDLVQREFDTLIEAQRGFGIDLSDEALAELRRIIFFQRPLKPVDPGVCTFEPTEPRAVHAWPVAQRFRMLSELSNLRILAPGSDPMPITSMQRSAALDVLSRKKSVEWSDLRKALDLDDSVRFNLESEARKGLKGDETSTQLTKKDLFGPTWWKLSAAQRDRVVEILLDEDDPDTAAHLLQVEFDLARDRAEAIADVNLPESRGRLSRKALERIVPFMETGGLAYHEAAAAAGYHHSDFRPGALLDRLPYYGAVLPTAVMRAPKAGDPDERQWGKIGNPTVHIGLRQLAKVVNALIDRYGKPEQVVIELARDLKLNASQKEAHRKRVALDTRVNNEARSQMEQLGVKPSQDAFRRYRLWKRQAVGNSGPLCVYTGRPISLRQLWSNEVEVDHVLPFARSLDNSMNNLVACFIDANRAKTNRTPYEAFAEADSKFDWEGICARAAKLGPAVAKRFTESGAASMLEEGRFLDRQLNETAYLSRTAKAYLAHVCDFDRVWVTPGHLTWMLRRQWGLDSILGVTGAKNRNDHRHHAVDALVIGLTDRRVIKAVATAAGRSSGRGDRDLYDVDAPWQGFRADVEAAVQRIVVSHRQDHGREGQLHNETAYGVRVSGTDPPKLTERRALASLKASDVERVIDGAIRKRLEGIFNGAGVDSKQLERELRAFALSWGVRKVKLEVRLSNVATVADAHGRPYKAYKTDGNYCMDIFRTPDGKIRECVVSRFDAQRGGAPPWKAEYPAGKLLTRIVVNDAVELPDKEGTVTFYRVNWASPAQLCLVAAEASGDLRARHYDSQDSFRYVFKTGPSFWKSGGRKVHVDVLGSVRRPPS